MQNTRKYLKKEKIMHSLNIREDLDNLSWEELYPGIILYKNMLKDPLKAYEVMMRSEESSEGKYFFKKWDPWAHFGTYTQAKSIEEQEVAEKGIVFEEEKALFEEIAVAYDRAISHYFKHTEISIPENARYSGQSWCKYFNKIDNLNNNMTMQYHTDYIISQSEMPGEKFHTTCTFYINDNYNGGDVEFYVNGDIMNYKPSAGDLMIFPSRVPYYHGVKTIPDGNKFFIRNFIMEDFNGSEEWLENQRKFGAYKWAQKELERIKHDDPRNMLYLKDNNIISYDDLMQLNSEGDNDGTN
jgi:hypothetical protein